jgi:hypothetical protein
LTWTSLIRIPRTKNETLEEKSPVAVSIWFFIFKTIFGLSAV